MEGWAQVLENNRNARIGVLDTFFADELTAWDAATGWNRGGIIVPGSFQPSFNKDKAVLESGFPRTVKVEAITRINGALSFNMQEYNTMALALACGSGAPVVTAGANPAPTTAAAGGTVSSFSVALGAGAAAGYAKGMLIGVVVGTTEEFTYIKTISGDNLTVQPPLSAAPATGAAVRAVKDIKYALGTQTIERKAFKSVFTDQHGDKAIIYCPSVGSTGGYVPNFGDAQAYAQIPLTLQAYGIEAAWNGRQESIVGYTILAPYGVS